MGCVRSSPTRGHRAGALLTHRTAVPAVVATPRPEPARRNERSPFPAPDRTAVTAELHGGTRPHVPREKLRTTILPARLPRHPAVHPLPGAADRVLGQPHERPDGAPALVPLLLPGTGPGPPRRDPVPHLARRQCGTSQRPRRARPRHGEDRTDQQASAPMEPTATAGQDVDLPGYDHRAIEQPQTVIYSNIIYRPAVYPAEDCDLGRAKRIPARFAGPQAQRRHAPITGCSARRAIERSCGPP